MDKEELIEEIIKCNSIHKNCDFLLEHSDCDCLTEIFEENKQLKGQLETYEILLKTQQKQIDDVKEWFKAKQILTDIDDVCNTDKFWEILGDSNE